MSRKNGSIYRNYTAKNIEAAMEYFSEHENVTLRATAKKFSIPNSTLHRFVTKQPSSLTSPLTLPPLGRTPYLDEANEKKLCAFIVKAYNRGFALTQRDVGKIVIKWVREGQDTKNTSGELHPDWWERFLKRNLEVVKAKEQYLEIHRATSCTTAVVNHYFNLMAELKKEFPNANIWNIDETGLGRDKRKKRNVLVPRGERPVEVTQDQTEHVSLVCAASHRGETVPPMMIYKGRRLQKYMGKDGVEGAIVGVSDTAFLNEDLWKEYIHHFLQYAYKAKPMLVIVDGCTSHFPSESLWELHEKEVHMIMLPPHSTHVLQPLDCGIFAQLKSRWALAKTEYLKSHRLQLVGKPEFASLLRVPYYEVSIFSPSFISFISNSITLMVLLITAPFHVRLSLRSI